MAEPSRRRVSYGQLEVLWEFLNRRRDIALGFNKSAQAREFSRRMWQEIALSLNSQGDGAEKDWRGWCKYWNDYKSKLKKLAVATQRSNRQTGGGPSTVKPMTDIEKKILEILGSNFGSGLPGIRVEPFEQEAGTEIVSETGNVVPSVAGGSDSILTNLHLVSLSSEINEPGPSLRVSVHHAPTTPPLPSTPPLTTPPRPPPATSNQSTPRHSPRRRRLRREPPMTAEVARRALVRESQRRADIDERNSAMLRQLVDEIKEIKEMLRRFSEHPRGDE